MIQPGALVRGAREPWDPYREVLGSLFVEMYHAKSCAAAAWVGANKRSAAQTAGAPVIAASGTKFGLRPVPQFSATGSKAYRAVAQTAYAVSGTKPWIWCVGRFRSQPAGTVTLFDLGVSGSADSMILRNVAGTITLAGSSFGSYTAGAADLLRHSYQLWVGAVNANCSIDNAAPVTANVAGVSLTVTCTALGLGSSASGAGQFPEADLPLWLMASSLPSVTQIAQIEQLGLRDFPNT